MTRVAMFLTSKIMYLNYKAHGVNKVKMSHNNLWIFLFISATQNIFYLYRKKNFDYLT